MSEADSAAGSIAARVRNAYVTQEPIAPIRDELAPLGIAGAYAVQVENIEYWQSQGRRVVGRKIGLTSVAVQRQLGVDQPDYGALFADMCLVDGEPVPAGAVLQPKVEAEAALVLKRDLERPDLTISELIASIDAVYAAIEVVGSRIAGWDISILDTIADNASSMEIDGVEVSSGIGSNCLGHPYRAALWLARRMAELGTPLRTSDVLMTGAMGAMAPLAGGSTVTARIDGLGTVSTAREGGSE